MTNARANLIGMLWMIAAMAGFAVEDALLKAVSQHMPVAQMLMLFGIGGACIFAMIARIRKERLFTKTVLHPIMRLRAVFELSGRLLYILALAFIPLSTATVILQATPLVVVASAALFLGEHVGWRRWAAIFIGLLGVVIIIRPGGDGFTLLSLLAVGGMLGFAGRDLLSRLAPKSLSTTHLGFYGFLTVFAAGSLYSFWEAEPFTALNATGAWFLFTVILLGPAAYSALMMAMRTGDVSAVTPFRYTRLIFGVGIGILAFNEALDLQTVIGSLLILVSGLFILWRAK